MWKGILTVIVIVVAILGLGYGMSWFGVFAKKTVGKAHQNADTEIFYRTKAYIEGKNQEGFKLKLEYELEKDETTKLALRRHIVNQFSRVNTNDLDPSLALFIERLK